MASVPAVTAFELSRFASAQAYPSQLKQGDFTRKAGAPDAMPGYMRLVSVKTFNLKNHIKQPPMKKHYFLRISAALLLVLFLSSYLPAQTNISGTVSGTWSLSGSPYLIVGDANVPAGSNLQIEAGVSVQFTGEYILEVFGNIQAIGTEQDSIEFRPVNTGMYTKGLHITNGQDTCRLKYCIFKDFKERTEMVQNYAKGGALYAITTKLTIERSHFCNNRIEVNTSGNDWEFMGGAICLEYCYGYISYSRLNNNRIIYPPGSHNLFIRGYGGAIYTFLGNIEIKYNLIESNYIHFNQNGDAFAFFWGDGGAIYTNGWVRNNRIQNNYCKAIWVNAESGGFIGGTISCLGGAIYGGSIIKDNLISGNYCYSSFTSTSAVAVDCSVSSMGGGIYAGGQIENNIIYGNHCTSYGFANAIQNLPVESFGGGIYQGGQMTNNTVLSNSISASGNGGISMQGSGISGGVLKNCVAYNNTGSTQVSSATSSYSCIQDGYPGIGNISGVPLFVAGPDGEYYLSQLAAGQSQQSPCVDAGDPNTPLFQGTTRTDNLADIGIIDMGYHYPTSYRPINSLDVKVMLQGPFSGTGMQTNLNTFNYLPLTQPFQGPPWNYSGTESVTTIPNSNIVDWVLLELRQAPDASQAVPGTLLWRQACFVDNTGKITGLGGNATQPVSLLVHQVLNPGDSLFVIVWHRNHLGVLSAEPMQEIGFYTYSYDFTIGAGKAYGGVNGHIEVGQDIWGMVSGDGDANGQINNVDKVEVWKPQGGFSGYRTGDFNLDGQVNNQDKIDFWGPNSGRSCQASFTVQGSLPTLTTSAITNITDTTAMGGGNVTEQGTFPLSDRGVCWSTTTNPDIYDFHTHSGCGLGTFTSLLTGLTDNTTYFVRAFAANNLGISYGNQVSFTTLAMIPEVSTTLVTNITDSTAIGGGEVTSQGSYPVTARGVCWSTSQSPTLNDTHTVDGSGPGVFISQLTGLNPWTTYYVRAYATNQAGTSYGNQINFITQSLIAPCPGIPTITYGGQVYNTVLIGTQCWLKENLNIGTVITGGTNQANNGTVEKYCYNNLETNCTIYGGLYQWDEMMQYVANPGVKGICPDGWHIPTDEEWKVLEGYADSQYDYTDPVWDQTGWRGFDAGKNLKSTSGWDSNGNGTDLFGFTALPGGYWMYYGFFGNAGTSAFMWTSTEYNSSDAMYRLLNSSMVTIFRSNYNKADGHSVRCLKD